MWGLNFLCVAILVSTPTADSVATVDLQRCLAAVPRTKDLIDMQADIQATETEAKRLLHVVLAAEAASEENPTFEEDRAESKRLRAEFERFRKQEQRRLAEAEQRMFNGWLQTIQKTVGAVAKRHRHNVVLFTRTADADVDPMVPQFTSKQIVSGVPEIAYLAEEPRPDLTDAVIAELKQIPDTQEKCSEQSHAPELRSVPNL